MRNGKAHETPAEASADGQNAAAALGADTIDQVRELLFGHEKRRTEQNITELRAAIDDQLDALRGEMRQHVDALTARLMDLERVGEQRRLDSISDIGQAIAQLGASIQNMGADKSRR